MKKIFTLVIFCSLMSMAGFSQVNSHLSVNYEMSFATGDLSDYISLASFRGASIQYRYAVTHNILVGMDAAWNVFYEKKDYDTYTSGTVSLSGVQWRYQNEVPLLVCADYVFNPDKTIQPYLGVGLGTIYSERQTLMGIWTLEENPWQFALKPEVGCLFKFAGYNAFKLGVKYNTGFGGDLGTQGYVTVSAGVAFGF